MLNLSQSSNEAITDVLAEISASRYHVYAAVEDKTHIAPYSNGVLYVLVDKVSIEDVLVKGAVVEESYGQRPAVYVDKYILRLISVPQLLDAMVNEHSLSAAYVATKLITEPDIPESVRFYLYQALTLLGGFKSLSEVADSMGDAMRGYAINPSTDYSPATLVKSLNLMQHTGAAFARCYRGFVLSYLYAYHISNGSYPTGGYVGDFGQPVTELIQSLNNRTIKRIEYTAEDPCIQLLHSMILHAQSDDAVMPHELHYMPMQNRDLKFRHNAVGLEGNVKLTVGNIVGTYCYDTYVARYSTSRINWSY